MDPPLVKSPLHPHISVESAIFDGLFIQSKAGR